MARATVGRAGLVSALGMLLFVGCRATVVESPDDPSGDKAGIDPVLSEQVHAVMDESIDPCTDFYLYACGQWLEENPLPADQSRYGRFHALREHNKAAMRTLLEESMADAAASGESAKLGQFYRACTEVSDSAGLDALQPALDVIAGLKDASSLMPVLAQLHAFDAWALFRAQADAGFDDPHTTVLRLSPGGLGMPDRDYYLDEGPQADALRAAYVEHVTVMLEAAGTADAATRAGEIVALETALAQAMLPRAQMRDPERRRNMVEVGALSTMAPQLSWAAYFEALGQPKLARLNVAPPPFFEALGRIVSEQSPMVLQAYLRWHVMNAVGRHLPGALGQAHYEFFERRMRGQAEPTPRWRLCVEATDEAMGDALGHAFVDRHFTARSKQVSEEMIAQIEEAFAEALPQLAWMDDATRARALEKMHAIDNKIGYPGQWRDYSGLAVGDDHLANVVAGRRFEWQRKVGTIDKPVDPAEWHMSAPTVNAYYNPSGNEMVFPAGILQPPFFDKDRPMAMNFGGIGMVMGHELTHGFDDSGRKFDGEGRLTEWWGPDAVSRFEERAICVEKLYDSYEIQPGVTLNGKLTLGENIADLGGIRQAHGAYGAWASSHGEDAAPVVEGLTNEQLLFVSYGQIWCTQTAPETERVLARTDSHSHAKYRVNGPLSNFPAFWTAFSCDEGTPMHPAQVCEVW